MKLSPESDRLAGARRFGLELRKALAARGETQRGFSRSAGVGRTRLVNWVNGESLPPVEMASRLADLLTWPRLADLARAARERTCDGCGRVFVVESPAPTRYCSVDCRRFRAKARGARDLSGAVLERRVSRYRDAVNAMCAACEPGGVCQTPDCPLQVAGVSSLSVARRAAS